MTYADLFFLFIFLPICLITYFLIRSVKGKNVVLIVFSLIFYAWGEPLWIIVLLFSAVFNWLLGFYIGKHRREAGGKMIFALALSVNIAILLIFRYTGFFVETLNALFSFAAKVPHIRPPVGISFFTLYSISYITDCFRDTVKPCNNFPKYLLYISLFPKIIAGPIVKYHEIENELTQRSAAAPDIYSGIIRIVTGLSKKVLIADNLWIVFSNLRGSDISSLSFLGTWYAAILFSLYVYFEFSAYTDMAIGMGRIFGFHFEENFRHPFICESITDFCQRWNISLGSFFKEYLPFKLLFLWICIGLWYGPSWNFVLCGIYFGLLILLEQKMLLKYIGSWPVWLRHVYSKILIIIGFGIFCFRDLNQLRTFFLNITAVNSISGKTLFADTAGFNGFISNILLIIAAVICSLPLREKITGYYENTRRLRTYKRYKIISIICCMILLILCTVFLTGHIKSPFLYPGFQGDWLW